MNETRVVPVELLSCPFCLGSARLSPIRDGFQVQCICGAYGPPTFGGPEGWEACKAAAVNAWNKRQTAPPFAAPPTADAQGDDARTVRFIGIDPLNIAAGATIPMVPGSWRFGFTQDSDGGLRFNFRDDGPLVAFAATCDEATDAGRWRKLCAMQDDAYPGVQLLCLVGDGDDQSALADSDELTCYIDGLPESSAQAQPQAVPGE